MVVFNLYVHVYYSAQAVLDNLIPPLPTLLTIITLAAALRMPNGWCKQGRDKLDADLAVFIRSLHISWAPTIDYAHYLMLSPLRS